MQGRRRGIVAAVQQVGVTVAVVVRFRGNKAAAGQEVPAGSGLAIETASSLNDAAGKVVAAAGAQG